MIPVARVRTQPGVRKLLFICCEWQAVTYWPAAVIADVTGLNQVGRRTVCVVGTHAMLTHAECLDCNV